MENTPIERAHFPSNLNAKEAACTVKSTKKSGKQLNKI